MDKDEITICTVSYGHKNLIEMNIQAVKKLNPDTSPFWIIVNNELKEDLLFLNSLEKENIRIIEGVGNNFTGIGAQSYHHASGLNLAINEVNTRYALILDPDFYIVKKNWIKEIIAYMQVKDLAFFGVPYNPKRYMKYRYFPCVHCMFIDLNKVDRQKLDFNPKYQK